ncbi:MAG: type 4 pilus major pilin [Acetobacteraceae bacterium]|nr:type 4 pilus major pilin [Acetobacteraceae bacterium]
MSEMLGTLFKYLFAILGIGAVLGVMYSVVGDNKTANAVTQVSQLAANVQQLYAGQNNFTSVTNNALITAKAVPNGMWSGTALITDPWAGAVTVSVNDNSAAMFDISMAGVPAGNCAKISTSITAYSQLTINGGTVITPPADAAAITSQCTSTANTIVFTFSGS